MGVRNFFAAPALVALFIPFDAFVLGQQLLGYPLPLDLLGLSSACFTAVNVTIPSCPVWLNLHSTELGSSVQILELPEIQTLCESPCLAELEAIRGVILNVCTKPEDVMVPGGTIAYPPTYLIDRYIFGLNLSCLKDSGSGNYCDLIAAEWMNDTELSEANNCAECRLGIQKMQLESPFGYTPGDAAEFASSTSSCNADGYSYTTPTSYALNSTVPAPMPTCGTSTYIVEDGDDCVTIAVAHNISMFNLIQENALTIDCTDLRVGRSLCLPNTCTTYKVNVYDTCDMITTLFGITSAQLRAWNPFFINRSCSNIMTYIGWQICVSPPGGTIDVQPGDSVATTAPVPTDAQGESNTYCGKWYFVQEGDDCSRISIQFGVSVHDFFFLNPHLDKDCSNLWKDTSYCVKPVGNIETYTGYPISVPSTTFTRPPPATSYIPVPVPTPPLNPKAPGTIEDCYSYENAFDEGTPSLTDKDPNSCSIWAPDNVTVKDLVSWNPSLTEENCIFIPGYSYCLRRWETEPTPPTFPHEYCFSPDSALIPPTSVQPTDCRCYIQLRRQDQSVFTCSRFPEIADITIADITALNPWLGSDCDSNLWDAIGSEGFIQLCVEVGQGTPTSTSLTTPTPTASAPPAPTQPDAAENCVKWHIVGDGDGCWSIAEQHGISLRDFYSWNPGVGSECSTLWLDYAVCVGVAA